MFNIRKRLGASILLTCVSLVSITLLLPDSKVKQLQRVTLGTTIEYADLWKWGIVDDVDGDEEDNGNGIRLVILGDSWVDDVVEDGQEAKGSNWPQVLCEEINCTSRLNFAASQLTDAWPTSPPTGAMTSNSIHEWAISQNQHLRGQPSNYTAYPDLATQIRSFISVPAPTVQPQQTIFILSFGFWDLYDFAQLDLASAQNVTDTSVDFMFHQLDILYSHFATKLYPNAPKLAINPNTTEEDNKSLAAHKFQVIIPRIFEPTLLPGWITHRPLPPRPSSVAEQQKNAVYLTEHWNQVVENRMGAWMQKLVFSVEASTISTTTSPSPSPSPRAIEPESRADVRSKDSDFVQYGAKEPEKEPTVAEAKKVAEAAIRKAEQDKKDLAAEAEAMHLPKKDIFYHDTSSLLLDLIIEHQLEDEGISDASGLGKKESPFDSVYTPCMRQIDLPEDPIEVVGSWVEKNGMLVCKEADRFMWWDAWNLGAKGKEMVGKAIGELVKEGEGLRAKMEGKGS